jgi:hypothetical protein
MLLDFATPLRRREYIFAGFALAALKYAVDAAAIYAAADIVWTPLDYLLPLISVRGEKVAQFPATLNLFLLVWTLPFLWIGVALSVRRARDAAISPWLVAVFLAPLLNYLLMALLAAMPTRRPEDVGPPRADPGDRLRPPARSTILGVAAGVAAAMVMALVGILLIRSYGVTLFLGTPFVMGAVSAFVANRVQARSQSAAAKIGLLTLTFASLLLLSVALEGVICVLMAIPIAAPVTVLGALVGGAIAGYERQPNGALFLVLLVLPAAPLADPRPQTPIDRIVLTAIDVDAPPETVWDHVVSFSAIEAPPGWLFRAGLAYPIRARIDGTGPGAVRYCEFSTGAFREPITVWDAPRVLAFDVTAQPPPLRELSPYTRVYAPHIDGFFRTSHGEFRLVRLDGGRTRLEGRTWYSLKMAPAFYWTPIADAIVHAIHLRVLDHVKAEAEAAPRPLP